MMTVIPFRRTNRELVPICSCFATAAAAGTFITGGGSFVGALGCATFGRVRPLCARAGEAKEAVNRITINFEIKLICGTACSSIAGKKNDRGRFCCGQRTRPILRLVFRALTKTKAGRSEDRPAFRSEREFSELLFRQTSELLGRNHDSKRLTRLLHLLLRGARRAGLLSVEGAGSSVVMT